MAYASWSVIFGEQPSAAKWNILGTNDAHFYSFLGDNLAYTSYVPTFTNLTIGNGALTAYYKQTGKLIHYYGSFTLGSTSAVGTDARASVPVNMHANVSNRHSVGIFNSFDTSASTFFPGFVWRYTAEQSLWLTVQSVPGAPSFVQASGLGSGTPITWATGDVIWWDVKYEGA